MSKPKPFLKKGTRQFLSNAQVRSQTQKSKIVCFDDDSEGPLFNGRQQLTTLENKSQQIKILVKPKIPKSANNTTNLEQSNSYYQKSNHLQSHPHPYLQQTPTQQKSKETSNKVKAKANIISSNKRKPMLQDYIGQEIPEVTRNYSKEKSSLQSHSKQKQKKPIESKVQTMAALLKKQEISDDDNLESSSQQEIDKQLHYNHQVNRDCHKNSQPSKPQVLRQCSKEYAEQEYNFNSGSDSQGDKPMQTAHFKYGQYQYQQCNKPIAELKKPTLVAQKYFNKGKKLNQAQLRPAEATKIKNSSKPVDYLGSQAGVENQIHKKVIQDGKEIKNYNKIQMKDITIQLKNQIINEYIQDNKQKLIKQIQKIKQESQAVRRERQKYEQEFKGLAKNKKQFEKQMEDKLKEFQQRIKTQTNRINREKRYVKQQYTSNSQDRKTKYQIQELKTALQTQAKERKATELKLKTEIDRLKKKLDQQCKKNHQLVEEQKLMELNRLREKEEFKQKERKKQPTIKVNAWANAPKESYLAALQRQGFSLTQLLLEQYDYRYNEYYKFYLTVGQSGLVEESRDQKKIIRRYENGKIEHEQEKKFIKEIFPFGFTIVHHQNGDVKQTTPEGLTIYYNRSRSITEFSVGPNRRIYYFYKNEQVEMEQNSQRVEVYDGNRLQRLF